MVVSYSKVFKMSTNKKIKISIIGAGGYTGEELLRLLISHSKVEVVEAVGRSLAGRTIGEVFADLKDGYNDLKFSSATDYNAELFFVCLPHGESMGMVADLIGKGKKVIDLSADFRLSDIETYEKWYVPHTSPELIKDAVYGLPELNPESYNDKIKDATLVANPGCYPTGALLALIPIADSIEPSVIIDSKSGTSGAGKSMEEELNTFTEAGGFKAYKIGSHRHTPEIKQGLDLSSGHDSNDFKVTFTPHLLPVFRGILTTAYATLKDGSSTKDLIEKYKNYYIDKPFVSILEEGNFPDISDVAKTNNCQIGVYVNPNNGGNGRDVTIVSVIDNLVKGASGEAIQNMNLMYGFDETEGLM